MSFEVLRPEFCRKKMSFEVLSMLFEARNMSFEVPEQPGRPRQAWVCGLPSLYYY